MIISTHSCVVCIFPFSVIGDHQTHCEQARTFTFTFNSTVNMNNCERQTPNTESRTQNIGRHRFHSSMVK